MKDIERNRYGHVYHHNPDVSSLMIKDKPLVIPTKSNPDVYVEMGLVKQTPVIKNVYYPDYMSKGEVERKAIKVQQKEKSCPLCRKAKKIMKEEQRAGRKSIIARPHILQKARSVNKREALPLAAVGYDAVQQVRNKRPRLIRLGKRRKAG